MKLTRALLVYSAAVFIGAAIASPWLYKLSQFAAALMPAFEGIARQPFHRFVNRALLVFALGGIWPVLKLAGLRSFLQLGIKPVTDWLARFGRGLLLGIISLSVPAVIASLAGARHFTGQLSLTNIGSAAVNAAAIGLVVSILEELFFRGALYGILRREHRGITALAISSAIYAIVHFFERAPDPKQVEWVTGFDVLGQMLRGFWDVQSLFPGFFTLIAAGWLLAAAYERTGNLYYSIGIHCGWIFALKLYGSLTEQITGDHSWFWGSARLLDGWMTFGALILVLVFFLRNNNPQSTRDRSTATVHKF